MATRSGRRPGESGTREAILDAARHVFAAEGFDGATIRKVAAAAWVDPKLVHHFYGTKHDLFVAAIDLPADPATVIDHLLAGSRRQLGERVTRWFLAVMADPSSGSRLEALVRTAATDAAGAAMLRQFLQTAILRPLAGRLDVPDAELRVALAHSQLVGLLLARQIIGVDALRDAEHDALVAAVAPTVQRYLTGRVRQ